MEFIFLLFFLGGGGPLALTLALGNGWAGLG